MNASSGRFTAERWAKLDYGHQILRIAKVLQRAAKLTRAADQTRRRAAFDRVYELVDLTLASSSGSGRRRDLLRWREDLSGSYLASTPVPEDDRALLRALLRLDPASAAQIPLAGS